MTKTTPSQDLAISAASMIMPTGGASTSTKSNLLSSHSRSWESFWEVRSESELPTSRPTGTMYAPEMLVS